MKRSRFSDSQIMAILKQAESETEVPTLCREHGMKNPRGFDYRPKKIGVKNRGQSKIGVKSLFDLYFYFC